MALDKSGLSLRQWRIGELIAMTIIGALAGLGTWALGLGASLALGLFVGRTDLLPIVGPFAGAAPVLLLLAVFAFGLLFGATGVVVAAHLTILLHVLVRELYVRRMLGEQLGKVMAEGRTGRRASPCTPASSARTRRRGGGADFPASSATRRRTGRAGCGTRRRSFRMTPLPAPA